MRLSILLVFSQFDLFSFLCLSYSSWLFDSLNPVRFPSPVCLFLTSVILLILRPSIVSRYTAFLPSHTSPPLPIYFLTSRSLLSRLHSFLSCFSHSCPPCYLSLALSQKPLLCHPPSPSPFRKQMLFVRSYHYWLIKKTSLLLLLLLLFPLISLSVASIPHSLFFLQEGLGRGLIHTLLLRLISGWLIERVLKR